MYCKIWQEGIEPIKDSYEVVKDEKTSHCYFDDFRIALHYSFNEKEKISGVGALSFAPNGLLWSQSGVFCSTLDKFGSLYYGIDQILEEADKSKAKRIIVFIDDKEFVEMANKGNPYKSEAHNQVHKYFIDKLKKYESWRIVYRDDYPESVKKRLEDESMKASEPPEISPNGQWFNSPGLMYFNIASHKEEDDKAFAEQLARIYMDFMKNYTEEYEKDYGKEALRELIEKAKNKELKELPPLKRHIENEKKSVRQTKFPKLKKTPLCQNCGKEMALEDCFMEYPKKILKYHYRCKNCLAVRIMNEKGRTITYGRYPPKKKENRLEA